MLEMNRLINHIHIATCAPFYSMLKINGKINFRNYFILTKLTTLYVQLCSFYVNKNYVYLKSHRFVRIKTKRKFIVHKIKNSKVGGAL